MRYMNFSRVCRIWVPDEVMDPGEITAALARHSINACTINRAEGVWGGETEHVRIVEVFYTAAQSTQVYGAIKEIRDTLLARGEEAVLMSREFIRSPGTITLYMKGDNDE